MSERIEWIEGADGLRDLAGAWDALADNDPFMTARWLAAWQRAFAPPDSALTVCTVWRDEQLVAGLPLLRHGRTLSPLANDETSSYHPLAADGAALHALMSAALRAAAGGQLTLPMVPAGDPLLADGSPWRALTTPYCVSPVAELGDGFDAWREATRPKWRAPIERLARKMEREHEMAQRMIDLPREGEIERGFALELDGWKGAAGSAILSREDTARFYREVAQLPEARISVIELDGELAAFALCLLFDNRLWQLKIAFDESRKALAPGLVMHLKAIERACDIGLDAYELLGDEAEWKRKFSTADRAFVRWTGYAPASPAATARYTARRAGRALRSLSPGRSKR